MKSYAIKYEDGYSFAGRSFSKNLSIASCYESKEQCQRVIDYYDLQDCKIVEVIITETDILKHNIKDRIVGMNNVIHNIESDIIKHKSKTAKEKDLNIQRGYLLCLQTILSDIEYYENKKENN